MSPGGIPFEFAPFFAMADAARRAIDDAVSKPLHRSAELAIHIFTYGPPYQIQTARQLGTSKARVMR